MIIGVDIGGTKTLIGIFTSEGELNESLKFPTPQPQAEFVPTLLDHLRQLSGWEKAQVLSIAVPGPIDYEKNTVISCGRLPWEHFAIKDELASSFKCKVVMENDANLAALAEVRALPDPVPLALYITLSTGIGSGVIVNNQLLPELRGSEAGQMVLRDEDGTLKKWENIASGKTLFEETNHLAADLTDSAAWADYINNVVLGLQPTMSVLRPNAIILGGGVGAHFDKFGPSLVTALDAANLSKSYKTPPIHPPHYNELSVLYGCYEYGKDQLA
jgi:glucokinase